LSDPVTAPDRPRSRGLGWPIAMSAILGFTVVVNLFVFRLAASDPSFSVEPSYYQKAVHWDDELAQRRHNADLGWQATTQLVASNDGLSRLRVRLTDSAGVPLDGAQVRLQAFAINRASQVTSLALSASDDPSGGVYSAVMPDGGSGRWELKLDVIRESERFTSVSRVERPK